LRAASRPSSQSATIDFMVSVLREAAGEVELLDRGEAIALGDVQEAEPVARVELVPEVAAAVVPGGRSPRGAADAAPGRPADAVEIGDGGAG